MAERHTYNVTFTMKFSVKASRVGKSFADACANTKAAIEKMLAGHDGLTLLREHGYLDKFDGIEFHIDQSTVTIPEHVVPVSQEDEALRMLSQVREV